MRVRVPLPVPFKVDLTLFEHASAIYNYMTRKYTRWSKDLLEPVVAECKSIAQVLDKLGLKPAGGNYANLKHNLHKYNIDTSHFTGQGWNAGNYKPLGELKSKASIRRLVLEEVNNTCEHCGITEWQGKPITLELDHINGDNTDNSRENLRILCPNCHSQTSTFRNQKRNITPS